MKKILFGAMVLALGVVAFQMNHANAVGPVGVVKDNSAFCGASNTGSVSCSFAVSGANRMLIVSTDNNGNFVNGYVSGVTYGGMAMTKVATRGSHNTYESMWYLFNPPVGTSTLTVSANGGATLTVVAESFDNVAQLDEPSVIAATTDSCGNSNLCSFSLHGASRGSMIVLGASNGGTDFTCSADGANCTNLVNGNGQEGSGNGDTAIATYTRGSGKAKISITMLWNGTANLTPGIVLDLDPATSNPV